MREHDAEGADWIERNIGLVNELLGEHGLPAHVEATQSSTSTREHCGSFPTRSRACTKARADAGPRRRRSAGDPAIEHAATLFDTHLICHSDAEGYYVPIDFAEVIIGSRCSKRRACRSRTRR